MRKPKLRAMTPKGTELVSSGAYPPPPGGSSFLCVSFWVMWEESQDNEDSPTWPRFAVWTCMRVCEHAMYACGCVYVRTCHVCVCARVPARAVVCMSSPLVEGGCVSLCTGKRTVNKPEFFTAPFSIHPEETVYFWCIWCNFIVCFRERAICSDVANSSNGNVVLGSEHKRGWWGFKTLLGLLPTPTVMPHLPVPTISHQLLMDSSVPGSALSTLHPESY